MSPRDVSAEDEEGPLFTGAELRAALPDAFRDRSVGEQIARDITTREPATPGISWTENILVFMARAIPERAERIRQHLGYTPEQWRAQLVALEQSFPWDPAD